MSDREWSRSISWLANRDVFEILIYTREMWGLDQVDVYELALIEGLERIRSFPEVGSLVPSLGLGVRKWQVRHHVIYYEVDNEKRHIAVLRILHERRKAIRSLLNYEAE